MLRSPHNASLWRRLNNISGFSVPEMEIWPSEGIWNPYYFLVDSNTKRQALKILIDRFSRSDTVPACDTHGHTQTPGHCK